MAENETTTDEKGISSVNIEDEMKQCYLDYAMSVIIGRALPDVKDGLKPVQRRVIYAMYKEGLLSNKKYAKCAGVVGQVLKEFHPHGDAPAYEALVSLAQEWAKRYPLVEGQGNFGSIDGDPPAAFRYTECRLSAIAELLLEDINEDTVDFVPNFDESSKEPVVLPSAFPNLLANGSDGIAVGMATHIPPHNLSELVDGIVAYIDNRDITVDELMEYIKGPDFPTGGIICGTKPIRDAYLNGKGILQIRGKADITTIKKRSKEIEAIIISEIPYQVNKARLVEKIASLVSDKKIKGISNIKDESNRDGIRIIIELKKDAVPDVVLNQLYKNTPLQTSFGVINLAIVNGKPLVCSLKDLIELYVNHRRDVIVRRTNFRLKKAEARMHILEGFRIALMNLDDVIALIKKSDTPKSAKDALIKRYGLTDVQAQAILDLKLQKLTGMERLAIEKEHEELAKEIDKLKAVLNDSKKVDQIIKDRLVEIKDKFGDDRRTEIVETSVEIDIEDLIAEEDVTVAISHEGYIKRMPVSVFRTQRRGGKGVSAGLREDDFTEHLFVCSNKASLLCFTTSGKVYWLKVYQVPETSRTARGRALINLLNLNESEKITAVLPVSEFKEGTYVFFTTKMGYVKRVDLTDFSRKRSTGVRAITLSENDVLIDARLTSGDDHIILETANGMCIRFDEGQIRVMGRQARGVRGIRLGVEDYVASAAIVPDGNNSDELSLLTVCEHGFGKRTRITEYRVQARGGKGVIDIKTSGRNGRVVKAFVVDNNSELMIMTSGGKGIRIKSKDISIVGRNTKGVRLVNLDEGEIVTAVARIIDYEN